MSYNLKRLPVIECEKCGLESKTNLDNIKLGHDLITREDGTREARRGFYARFSCPSGHTKTKFFPN
ncbi:hypothetical protein COE81_16825 [Bacillus wiedmannii]|nr:hypothetical protein COE81_16825 [Bacillus wiedmannii]